MRRNWTHYLSNSQTNVGRTIVEQGRRIHEARRALPEKRYLEVLKKVGITPRDARKLSAIGHRLHPLVDNDTTIRLPIRIRTLSSLSELSSESLFQAAADGLIHGAMTEADVRALRGPARNQFARVIRPTDNWSFSTLRWPRLDGWDGHGYIPGDLYANCLWYYARAGDAVADPMAGSGMILKVWEDRAEWLSDQPCELYIALSDLVPRGPYAARMEERDLLADGTTVQADYIIIDPPYCGLVNGQYSDSPHDLANMEPAAWVGAMKKIAEKFGKAQPEDGRCTVIVPNNRTLATGERILFPELIRRIFRQAGYNLYDVTYASRRTQQKQGRGMAILNNRSRSRKLPLADISEVLTFINGDSEVLGNAS